MPYIEAMPKGPQGQKRPADAIGAAIAVARIATGEDDETPPKDSQKSQAGKLGGRKRAEKLTAKERHEIAKHAASAKRK